MDYSKYTREELIVHIEELTALNRELLSEKEQENKLDFAWSGNLGHWYFNIKTGNVVFNPLKIMALGYSMDEMEEKVKYTFFTDKLHPDDYDSTMNAMTVHMKGEISIYETEYRIQAKDGSYKWFYDRGKITVRDSEGKPEFAAGIVFDITDKKLKEQQIIDANVVLEHKSTIDALTGIRNRGAIMEELEVRIEQAKDFRSPLTIVMLDIDHFKKVNDTLGHVFGDKVLKRVAEGASYAIRGLDSLGRYGGEEMLVILPNTPLKRGVEVAERIRQTVETLEFEDGFKVTLSGGVAAYEGESLEEFIAKADSKLYDAKRGGRNQIMG